MEDSFFKIAKDGNNTEQRLRRLCDIVVRYSAMDFSQKAEISNAGDEIDAIAAGLNALAEEIGHARQTEKGYIRELEKTNRKLKKTEEHIIRINAELEEKVAERTKEILRSEKKFRALIENSNDWIGMLNEKGEVIYVTPSASKIDGFTSGEPFDRKGLGQIHPDDSGHVDETIKEAFKNPGKPIQSQYRIRHKNGNWIWTEGTMTNFIHDHDINAIVVNFRNINDRKEAEEKLIHSENQFRSSLDIMFEGIQIIGFDWKYLYVNNAVARQGKYSKEELLGCTMMEKYPGIESTKLFTVLKHCMEKRVSESLENQFLYPDGSEGWFDLSIQPVPEGILVLSIDITERKRAQVLSKKLNEELEKKVEERTKQLLEVNKELEAFSYSVSHDLRAPLRAVNGYAKMVEDDYSSVLDKEGKRLLSVVQHNARKMGMLIDDLLAFSRLGRQELQKSELNMDELAEGALSEFNKSVSHKAKVKIASLHMVKGDYALINQVLINLISNAVKYSSKAKHPVVNINSEKKDGEVIFSVTDNGVGFDMKYIHKLFGVFQRLHGSDEFEGTGVGLAIVQRIIHKHGGRVWAEGKLNHGAAFYFSLPS